MAVSLTSGRTRQVKHLGGQPCLHDQPTVKNPGQPGSGELPGLAALCTHCNPLLLGSKVVPTQLPGTAQLDTHAWSLWDPVLCGSLPYADFDLYPSM